MIIYEDITSSYLLVSDLAVVEFAATGEMSLVVADAAGERLLSCRYQAANGVVRVYDLDRLLSPLIAGVMADFTFTVDGSTRTLHIMQSRVRVSESADVFLSGRSVTLLRAALRWCRCCRRRCRWMSWPSASIATTA